MRREVWLSLLFLLAGWGVLAYTTQGEVSVVRESLYSFPHQVDGLRSEERPITDQVLQVLGLTDHLSRAYTADHQAPINFYVGYYQSQRTGATYHSPKNCLPGSGWQMIDSQRVSLTTPGGMVAEVNEIIIQKGTEKQVVMYWYHDRGRIIASEYMAKIYMVWDAATRQRTDGALVRVVVPVTGTEDAARQRARHFAQKALPLLPDYLPAENPWDLKGV